MPSPAITKPRAVVGPHDPVWMVEPKLGHWVECECGWISAGTTTKAGAEALHENHVKEQPVTPTIETTMEQLRLEQLRPHPQNIRFDVGDVTGLAEDIKSNGVLVPLVVAPHPQLEGDYIVIGGHRRLAASKQAGIAAVPCIIRHDLTDTAAQLETMIQENINRENLTPVEEAKAYQSALDLGVDVQRVAKASGRSQKTVKERLKLNKLSEEHKGQLATHQLTIERALVLADYSGDEDATKALEKAATAEKASDWEIAVKKEERRRAWEAALPALTKELEAAGVTIIERPEHGGPWRWTEYRVLSEYSPERKAKPYEERAELGHIAILDGKGGGYYDPAEIVWCQKLDTPPAIPREPTSEELERQRIHQEQQARRAELQQGLQLAAHVREEHILPVLKNPTTKQAAAALADAIVNSCDHVDTVELCNRVVPSFPIKPVGDDEEWDEDDARQTLTFELEKWPVERLAMLLHYLTQSREESLKRLDDWNSRVSWTWTKNAGWINALEDVYGYQLSDVEAAASEYFTPKERDEDA